MRVELVALIQSILLWVKFQTRNRPVYIASRVGSSLPIAPFINPTESLSFVTRPWTVPIRVEFRMNLNIVESIRGCIKIPIFQSLPCSLNFSNVGLRTAAYCLMKLLNDKRLEGPFWISRGIFLYGCVWSLAFPFDFDSVIESNVVLRIPAFCLMKLLEQN